MAKNNKKHGKQPNVEDRQGEKTHSAFLEGLQGSTRNEEDSNTSRLGDASQPTSDGHHRLEEDREQHDEAEKDSEYNRLNR